ncbi:hypothetical protein [Flavobacterium xanthum]|uniref:Uncharacterized protein n=1 Tax=Flavobacterium xanthum TaxID=69322 RepID=A0A1M7LPS1_9FLAO|nr:hypothetical protein [Flavobacterium xanthum]SHM80165.1 hypothetical protein SAMN05443669_10802 [Flavobacterium xanthum]
MGFVGRILYNKQFKENDLISKAGRDIVSDKYSNRSQYLQYDDIVIPKINEYKAGYDNELGIYHFLPSFDIEKQLWKFEVELDIKTKDGKQLHNPFINFSIVHFQPFSINYNDKTADTSLLVLKNDCRISDAENSTWCYLLPERKLSVYFDKPNWLFDKWGNVDLTVSFDYESLHHFIYYDENEKNEKWNIHSNFILTVEGSDDELLWYPVNSQIDNGNNLAEWGFRHALLTPEILEKEENLASIKIKFEKRSNPSSKIETTTSDNERDTIETNQYAKYDDSIKYSHFRVRFVEVEWFNNDISINAFLTKDSEYLKHDILNNEDMRIRYVELIY